MPKNTLFPYPTGPGLACRYFLILEEQGSGRRRITAGYFTREGMLDYLHSPRTPFWKPVYAIRVKGKK